MAKTDEQPISCSFCGKQESQARLIAGPGVYICSDCVQACCDLLREDEYTGSTLEKLPTPAEIKKFMDGYIIGQDNAKIALHSHSVTFFHPITGEKMTFASYPDSEAFNSQLKAEQ